MKVIGVGALATLGVASAAFSSGNNQFTIQHNGGTPPTLTLTLTQAISVFASVFSFAFPLARAVLLLCPCSTLHYLASLPLPYLSCRVVLVLGVTRRANVYAPAGYDANRPTPMVFNIHGLTSNGLVTFL
jgi:hypothetical protein